MTKDYKTHECANGSIVKVDTDYADVAQAAFTFYGNWKDRLAFVCPFCGNDDQWDNLTYECDGDLFEDTYSCDGCDTLITIITPYGEEYHDVSYCETTYEIDFMYGGEPSTWPDRDKISDDQLPLWEE